MFIVTYHNVLVHRPSAFNMLTRKEWTAKDTFVRELAWLCDRFEIVSLDEIAQAVSRREERPGTCAITFDDGYAGAFHNAVPALEEAGVTATFFVITAHVPGQGPTNHDFFDRLEGQLLLTSRTSLDLTGVGVGTRSIDCDACKLDAFKKIGRSAKLQNPAEREALAAEITSQLAVDEKLTNAYLGHEAFLPMSWQQLAELQERGFSIGSHTRTHATLSRTEAAALESEVRGSLDDLRKNLALDNVALAYPYGGADHVSEAAVTAARHAGYSCAVTMFGGENRAGTDLFQLERMPLKALKKLNAVPQ